MDKENVQMKSSNSRGRHDEKENASHAAAKGAGAKHAVVSTYTNLEPKRIIGSGSFGKYSGLIIFQGLMTVSHAKNKQTVADRNF